MRSALQPLVALALCLCSTSALPSNVSREQELAKLDIEAKVQELQSSLRSLQADVDTLQLPQRLADVGAGGDVSSKNRYAAAANNQQTVQHLQNLLTQFGSDDSDLKGIDKRKIGFQPLRSIEFDQQPPPGARQDDQSEARAMLDDRTSVEEAVLNAVLEHLKTDLELVKHKFGIGPDRILQFMRSRHRVSLSRTA